MIRLNAVVLDTDVFSNLYVRRNSPDPRVAEWRSALAGRRVLISFQNRAESLYGAMVNGWSIRRTERLRLILDRTPTIRADNEVVEAHARLRAECQRRGHALQATQHTGDRWVAACALAKGLDLLAGDQIYWGAPSLSLLSQH